MHTRQAAAFAAIERTGLTKSQIARIAGIHRSQVSRWVSGEQRPSYERVMRLAARLRRDHPDVADELVAATGYGPASADPEPELDDDQELMERLRAAYRDDPDKVRAAFEAVKWAESLPSGQRAGGEESTSERHAG